MNYTVIVLGIWALFQVAMAIWGLAILNNNCQTLSLYSRLRTLLTVSASAATVFFVDLLCNRLCHEDFEETSLWSALVTLVSSIMVIVMQIQISQDIDKCATNTDYYKSALMYGGIIPSVFPLIYGCWMLFQFFRVPRSMRLKRARERHTKETAALEEKKRIQEDEEQRLAREAEESERKIAAIAEEKARKAAAAERRAKKEFSAEEKLEMAQANKKKAAITKAKDKLEEIETKMNILDPTTHAEELIELGKQLKKAKDELKEAEGGVEKKRPGGFVWGGGREDD